MCDANNERSIEGLTALAARFIAETNDFLNRFWAHPSVHWPLKPLIGTGIGLPHCPASASPDRAATPTRLAHSERALSSRRRNVRARKRDALIRNHLKSPVVA
jgi:hypothetical protein